ncbi:MAG: PqqD family peptide modification chaperone, partial [Flammeovirgaceae bacterium]
MKTEDNDDHIIKLNEDVLIKNMGKEMILVYPKNALILSINELGAEIIDHIKKGAQSNNMLAYAIQSSYEVELETAKRDIS